MFRYLNIRTSSSTNQIIPPHWWTIERALTDNVNKAVDYYQNIPSFINSNNLLIQFLSTLPVSFYLDDASFYNKVKLIVMETATHHGMTTYRSTGKVFTNQFIGNHKEIFVATAGEYRPDVIKANWRLMQPVRILRHDFSQLTYPLLRGQVGHNTPGISFYHVDVVLLAMQYREFRLTERTKTQITGQPEKSINQFIANYVISHLIPSFVDQVLVNKYRVNSGIPLYDIYYNQRTPFNTLDIETRVDESIQRHVTLLRSMNKDIFTTLNTIPLINQDSVASFAVLPNTLISRSNAWALLYSKLPIIELGLTLGGQSVKQRNNEWLARFRTEMRYLFSDSAFSQVTSSAFARSFKEEADRIEQLLT